MLNGQHRRRDSRAQLSDGSDSPWPQRVSGLNGVGWMRGEATGREGPEVCPIVYVACAMSTDGRLRAMTTRPPNTAQLLLSETDDQGQPLMVPTMRLDELLELVGQTAREVTWRATRQGQGTKVPTPDTIALPLVTRLGLQLRPQRHDELDG